MQGSIEANNFQQSCKTRYKYSYVIEGFKTADSTRVPSSLGIPTEVKIVRLLRLSVALCAGVYGVIFSAQAAEGTTDIRCIVAGARLLQSTEADQQLSGQMILAYYLGRVDSNSPKADLESLIRAEAAAMTPQQFRSAVSQCGAQFSARATEIARIGKALAKQGL